VVSKAEKSDKFIPTTLDAALKLRAEFPLTPYAGGTDLMIDGRGPYLFLHRIPELRGVSEDGEHIRFGAGCTFTEVLENPLTPAILKDAVSLIGAPGIRNIGTIGGNIGNGSAKADSALIFFVTDSKIRLASAAGERVVPIEAFYLGRKKLDIASDELITEILVPKRWLSRYYYKKVGARKALAISRISFAGLMTVEDGKIAHCATAFGAVSNVIIRRGDIDSMLVGSTPDEARDMKNAYIEAFDGAIVPTQGRVSSGYRKAVCLNLLSDFLVSMEI
jgi:CO/xanthine dehydrogenase FAD-binding subunit